MNVWVVTLMGACLWLSSSSFLVANSPEPAADEKKLGFKKKAFDQRGLGASGKWLDGSKRPRGEDRNRLPAKPFLMAGDPRFEQMLKLALVDEDKLNEALEKWPRLSEMSDFEKNKFTRRVNAFRERLRKDALEDAEKMGLNIPEAEQDAYFRSYWNSRMQIERKIRKNAESQLKEKMQGFRQRLQQQWAE